MERLKDLQPWGEGGPTPNIPGTAFAALWSLGIIYLGQVLEQNGTHVLDGKALKLKFSRVKAKHVAAFNRLAHILNEPPGKDYDLREYLSTRDASLTLPRDRRRINPGNQMLTALAINPTVTTIAFPSTHDDQRPITEAHSSPDSTRGSPPARRRPTNHIGRP